MSAPSIGIVIPATDSPPTLDRCLAAIEAGSDQPELLITVTEPPMTGPAAARNVGVAELNTDVVLFVDADCIVHSDAVARIRSRFAADPELAAVFGSYDDEPEAPGLVSRFRNLLHHHVHTSNPGPASTFWAGLGAVRRDRFERVFGFDEGYKRPSVEDIEFGLRLTDVGGRIELDPAIRCTHLKRWTLNSMVRTDFAQRGVPWVMMMARRGGPPPDALNLAWRHRLSALASLVAVLALPAGLILGSLPAAAAAGLAALFAILLLNRDFYALALTRLGPTGALVSLPLHVLHHLSGVAAVPVGIVLSLSRMRRR